MIYVIIYCKVFSVLYFLSCVFICKTYFVLLSKKIFFLMLSNVTYLIKSDAVNHTSVGELSLVSSRQCP